MAQALNGFILPVIAILLFFLMNKPGLLPKQHQNGPLLNLLTGTVVYVTVLIGLTNIGRAAARAFGWPFENQVILIGSILVFAILLIPIYRTIRARRFE